jgi:hypothetical protein
VIPIISLRWITVILAFKDFILERRPEKYEFSDIDMTEIRRLYGQGLL